MNTMALLSISYGIYAIGVKAPDSRPSASIVNALIQVTAEPPCICVCINHSNFTNECIKNNGLFSVSVFSQGATLVQIASLGFTSGHDHDKLASQKYRVDPNGLPILEENVCTWFVCKVIGQTETATHTLFTAEIVETEDEVIGHPMTYEYYRTVVKGKTPKNAPHV